ncbi:hypothetical protein Bbelb_328850 [Branchiostoma belcheri]|nr:hypothetical protein Bbelb_328850 [Branchiostoma belcheri]
MDLEDDKGSSIEEGEVLEEGEIDDDEENVERTVSFLGNAASFGLPPDGEFPPGPLRVDFRRGRDRGRYGPPRGNTGFLPPPRDQPDSPGEWRFRDLLSRRGRGFAPEGVSFHGAMNLPAPLPTTWAEGRSSEVVGGVRGHSVVAGVRGHSEAAGVAAGGGANKEELSLFGAVSLTVPPGLRNRPDQPLHEAEPWLPWMKKYFNKQPNNPNMLPTVTPRDVSMTISSMSSLGLGANEGPGRRQDQAGDTEQYSDLLQNYRRIRSQLEEIER